MTKIVAFAGRKQAGKSTAGNFVFGLHMWSIVNKTNNEPLISFFKIDDKGRLIIPVDFGPAKGGIKEGIFNPTSQDVAVQMYLSQYVWPVVKMYSFADNLKSVCRDLLGLTVEQLYGTNEEKNTLTNIVWQDLPGFPSKATAKKKLKELGFDLSEDWKQEDKMSGRQVLQYVGTEIFRKMLPNVWADSTLKRINNENSEVAVITDCRFPNEADAVRAAGGIVIKLTRAPFAGQDEHASETALDDYQNFDAVIDNVNMTIEQQNDAIFDVLQKFGVVKDEVTA